MSKYYHTMLHSPLRFWRGKKMSFLMLIELLCDKKYYFFNIQHADVSVYKV